MLLWHELRHSLETVPPTSDNFMRPWIFLFPLTTATTGPLTIEVIAAVVDVVVVGVVAAIQPLKSDKIF